jgi:hypothetical protein
MTSWIRRNGRPLLIIALMVDLIGITVTRPAWQDNIGYRQPRITVPYGQAATIGGVRWELKPLTLPPEPELRKYAFGLSDLDLHPPNGRLVTYFWQRTKDGKPAGVPAGYAGCESTAVSGDRTWMQRTTAMGLNSWAEQVGYSTLCLPKYTGPLLMNIVVPKNIELTSIDVDFLPESWNDKTRLSKNSDLLVVRFDTR